MAYRYDPEQSRQNMATKRAANAAAHRAANAAARAATVTVGNNPAARAERIVAQSGARIRKGRRAGADKGQGEWRATSQNYRTAASIDARWHDTVSAFR